MSIPSAPASAAADATASTGIPGLDLILDGGLPVHHLYVVEGLPGSGKTTLALQFLMEGARRGENVLHITLSETTDELHAVARSHGWTLDDIHLRDLTPGADTLTPDEQYSIFHPAEVERTGTLQRIIADVERLKPSRVVFDSLSEIRLLADHPLRYRRQILALKHFFTGRRCTVLLLDDLSTLNVDLQVHSIAHGVIRLSQMQPEYGSDRRRLAVLKCRAVAYHGGYHDFVIRSGGLEVFPRLVPANDRATPERGPVTSGIAGLDRLIGGGLDRGTSTLIVGAAGTGKSSTAVQFAATAAARRERAAIFIFDESISTLTARTRGLGIPIDDHLASGHIQIQQVDPAELAPGQFAHDVRRAVDHGASLIVIDSLNGYLNAMPDERHLTIQLHELLAYLGRLGVTTILVGAQPGLVGASMETPADTSYLADAVILMRYFESRGEVRQAISVVKKRSGPHERTIRELTLGPDGIRIGEPLLEFHGVLTGIPALVHAGPDGDRP